MLTGSIYMYIERERDRERERVGRRRGGRERALNVIVYINM